MSVLLMDVWNENQLMSLFYSYITGSLHVSGPQAHLQESSYSCSHNHWFSICPLWTRALYVVQSTRPERYRHWTNGCVNSCTNSPEDGPVGPKHLETQQYTNKIVTSVGLNSIYPFLFNSISRWAFWRMCRSCITHKIKFTEINIKHCSWTGNSILALF